ncbi:hypothetical protein EV363DRAFT_1510732 [Boletus edulis]|nr:hypothetical protein EV363DRAFT_1510732 [Boletus edulis]
MALLLLWPRAFPLTRRSHRGFKKPMRGTRKGKEKKKRHEHKARRASRSRSVTAQCRQRAASVQLGGYSESTKAYAKTECVIDPLAMGSHTDGIVFHAHYGGHPPSRPQDTQQQDNNPPSQPPSSPPYMRSRMNGYQLHWMAFKLFMTLDELFNLLVERCWIQQPPNLNSHVLEDWRRH